MQKLFVTLMWTELAARSEASWSGLGRLPAGAIVPLVVNLPVSFLSAGSALLFSQYTLRPASYSAEEGEFTHQVASDWWGFHWCVPRWSRCDCWTASATNPPMAHCTSQLRISSLWRAALTARPLLHRRSGWVSFDLSVCLAVCLNAITAIAPSVQHLFGENRESSQKC